MNINTLSKLLTWQRLQDLPTSFFNSKENINSMKFNHIHLILILLLLVFGSCLSTHNMQKFESLYVGSKLKLVSNQPIVNESAVSSEIQTVLVPEPNSKMLWVIPIKLWLYNLSGKPLQERLDVSWADEKGNAIEEDKGLGGWIRRNWGEEPVKRSMVYPDKVKLVIQNRLENLGYFQSKVSYEIKPKWFNKQKINIIYTVALDTPYTISRLFFPDSVNEISGIINSAKYESLIRQGDNYSLSTFSAERDRIDKILKQNGFYFFNPDFIKYKVDTLFERKRMTVQLLLKPETPAYALNSYYINDIFVHCTSEQANLSETKFDTLMVQNCYYIQDNQVFKPELITNSLFLKKGDLYTFDSYQQTLKYLMNFGVIKYMKINMLRKDTVDANLLDMHVFITPLKKKSLNLELNTVTKSNNFAGPGFTATYNNRNVFGGAEKLTEKFDFGWESQFGSQTADNLGANSYEIGLSSELTFPRFFPFHYKKQSIRHIPKTTIGAEYRLMNQIRYYRMNTLNLRFGYQWKETDDKMHLLNLVSINYQFLGDTTGRFSVLLSENSLLKRSFENQFIVGTNYMFTYSNYGTKNSIHWTYFNFNFDISGNILHSLQKLIQPKNTENEYEFFNNVYAQYMKFGFDTRRYWNWREKHRLVFRLAAGIGVPWGNSQVLPYIKQFFIGGTNSIRAFPPRSIGPGSYIASTDNTGLFIDRTGDVKMESNLEYRFHVLDMVEIAAFIDAGNVWLLNEDTNRVSGKFVKTEFAKEIGIGTGLGLRFDAGLFVARLDVGFPVRRPDMPEKQRWVFSQGNTWNSRWHPTYNIAIGYPF